MSGRKQIVVCAALLHKPTGLIICGPRHFDATMRAVLRALDLPDVRHSDFEQGFVDQDGTFMRRKTAFHVATRAGQGIDEERNKGFQQRGELCSEGLY